MKVRNPRTGLYDYEIEPLSAEALVEKANQMRNAQKEWFKAGIDFRISTLQKWKNEVNNLKNELIEALCIDTGRKWETVLEVDLVASSIDRWCAISKDFFAESPRKTSSIPFLDIEQALVPYSLVGVISPWNFPLLLSLIDTIPALLAGSAVLVKPSEVAPRFIKVLQQSINEVPELSGILNYLEGAAETGAKLCEITDLICFTGSTTTGRKVYQAACDNFIPVFLELGGKDAVIVTQTADIDRATSAVLWGSVANAGQSCLSIERVYVHQSIFLPFVSKLVGKANQLNLAFPERDSGQIGPIISDKQVAIINDHLQDAIEKGASLKAGSSFCEEMKGGFYCRPTVLTNITHEMKVMSEETFGPIMPIMPFKEIQEAINLANDSKYGLSGAVFAGTEEEALSIAKQLKCGAISINDAALTAVMHEGEKNSFKLSGIGGTRMGPSAIKRFMKQKAYLINTSQVKDPWWFS
ncbi:MAG: aldehyde dehydrogenase family protein [Arcicella sp.]|nr:aldehyde dehydrogenase family protein [Arcicella sp.]